MRLTDVYVTTGRSETTGQLEYQVADKSTGRPMSIVTVKPSKRFGHFIVDIICINIFSFVAGIFFAIFIPQLDLNNKLNQYLVGALLFVIYYFASEVMMQTTLGKKATDCVVIDEFGDKPSATQIFSRSISRIIPFEAFSCLGDPSRGWHDSISETYVVEKSELAKMLAIRDEFELGSATAYNSLVTE